MKPPGAGLRTVTENRGWTSAILIDGAWAVVLDIQSGLGRAKKNCSGYSADEGGSGENVKECDASTVPH